MNFFKNKSYSKNFIISPVQTISFAQNGEDIVLNRAFPKLSDGFYVDVGAADPIVNSVTNFFYQKGWSGINIEPNKAFFQKLKQSRSRDINLNIGISSKSDYVTFYDCLTNKEWSTFSHKLYLTHKLHGVKFKKTRLKIDTLENIFDNFKPSKTIAFLKVDVEGLEDQVLKSNNWKKYRPTVIIIESNNPQECHKILSRNHYLKVLDDGLNLFYLDNKYTKLKKYISKPANIRDNFIPYRYQQLSKKFQEREKQLHQTFSIQYSLVKNELKKTQIEFHKLYRAYSEQINKNILPNPITSKSLIDKNKK